MKPKVNSDSSPLHARWNISNMPDCSCDVHRHCALSVLAFDSEWQAGHLLNHMLLWEQSALAWKRLSHLSACVPPSSNCSSALSGAASLCRDLLRCTCNIQSWKITFQDLAGKSLKDLLQRNCLTRSRHPPGPQTVSSTFRSQKFQFWRTFEEENV